MVSSNNKNNISNVLVVDDQAITRELLSRAIYAEGFAVDTAASGEDALDLWRQKKHAMVITDCHMPIKDGFRLTKDIRAAEKANKLSHTLVIAWTANSKEEEQEKCLNAGMDDFLSKPINFNQLKQLLDKVKLGTTVKSIPDDTNNHLDNTDSDIDFTILNQVANSPESQNKIIKDLINYIKLEYTSLKQHLESQDLTESKNIAHRLKGACKMIGANKVANAFALIEHCDEEACSNVSAQLLQNLNHAIVQLEQSTFCTA